MKRRLKVPEEFEVCGCRYVFVDPPLCWTEDLHRELSCDRCGQSLIVRFAYRSTVGANSIDPRWWIPTSVVCGCPGVEVVLLEVPWLRRKRKTDSRQPEFAF